MGVWTPGPGNTNGDDIFIGDDGNETVFGDPGNDTLSGNGGNDYLSGGSGDDFLDGGDGDDDVYGGAGDDDLYGGDGNDSLGDFEAGESGAASVYGGDGDDYIDMGSGFTIGIVDGGGGVDFLEWNGEFHDVIFSGIEVLLTYGHTVYATASQFESFEEIWYNPQQSNLGINLALSEAGSVDLAGQLLDRFANFYGSDGADTISLSNGNDNIFGGPGADFIYGVGGDDEIEGGDGGDQLDGGDGNDFLLGGYGVDVMYGGFGNDTLRDDGEFGGGTFMYGGEGDDLFRLDNNAFTGGIIDGGGGVDELLARGWLAGFTISGVEVLNTGGLWHTIATAAQFEAFTLIGHGLGGGTTSLELAASGTIDLHDELVAGTAFWGAAGNDVITMSAFGDDIYGMDGNDALDGREGSDSLFGGEGNDLLRGGLGGDTLNGGNGIDTADYLGATEGLAVYMGSGLDTGEAAGDFFSSIENLRGSNFDDLLVGNSGANQLNGEGGNDILDGATGADVLIGGAGNDTYYVDNVGDVVTEGAGAGTDIVGSSITFTLGANFENLTLIGAAAITGYGNALNNVITGNGAANLLYGFDGADTLDGGAGADQMFGGNGNDIYYVDNTGDVTSEVSALGGTDTVFSSVNRNLTANIENLTLTGAAGLTGSGNTLNNVITGNTGANTLYGFDGNDYLDGSTGADTLFGANGDDTYVVDNVNDITVEGSPTGGIDTVLSSIDRNLNANFENLTLTGTAQYGYGNVLNNVMTGNASTNNLYGFDGNDTLDGGAGADLMFGANGNDTYIVDNTGDVTSEASPSGGIDTVISSVTRNLTANLENLTLSGTADITGSGNALNNVIIGNSGANTLYGLDGADTLNGGLGADTLQGGTGADSYVFSTALGGGNIDSVVGFSVVDDTIVLSNAIFTGLAIGTLAAGAFRIGAAAADADDRIIYNSTTGALFFDADGNGGGAAVQFATLTAGLALTNNDFIVSGP